MSEKAIVVDSIDHLYDEKSKALICHINKVRRCFKHEFINASLCFNKNDYWINIEGDGWGNGYGGIRYCSKCKQIDCIHLWETNEVYEIKLGKYYSTLHNIRKCKVCGRSILLSSCGNSHGSNESYELIQAVCKETNNPEYIHSNYASGYFIELPVQVSEILDRQGEEAARQHIINCLNNGVDIEYMTLRR